MLKHRVQHHTIQQQPGTGKYQPTLSEQYGKYTSTGSIPDGTNIPIIEDGNRQMYPDQNSLTLSHSQPDGRVFAGTYPTTSNVIRNEGYLSSSPSSTYCEDQIDKQCRSLGTSRTLQTSSESPEEGVRIITEKYDSVGNLSSSSPKSSFSDGGTVSVTEMMMSQKFREGVSEKDLLQVDTFYRSHKTEVYVCACLANLFFGSIKSALNNDQWTFSCTGIPLLLLDTGEHHRERKLFIIVAEKGTGFTLWRDEINASTGYKTPSSNFHTMYTSKDHSQLAGFSFDDARSAAEFYGHVHKLTSDPNDDLFKTGNIKKKKSVKDKKKKIKLPKKTEISNPCCFVHVTKMDRPITAEDDSKSSANKSLNPNEISAPFNFKHMTASIGTGNDVNGVSNMMGSKLTLTSTSSIDSGLSDDRSSSKTGN